MGALTDIIFNMQHTIMNTPNTPNTSDKTENELTLDLQASPVPDHHQAAGSQLHQAEYVPTQTPTTREVHHLGRVEKDVSSPRTAAAARAVPPACG